MKRISLIIFLLAITNAHAWDLGAKFDAQRSNTNNVNLTTTSPTSDSYNTLSAYGQVKNEKWKYKLKFRSEKYATEKANNNNIADFSVQYKRTKTNDFTLNIFRQTYTGTTAVNNDTSSDNNGYKLATTITKVYDKENSGYLTLSGGGKSYPKMTNRKDTTFVVGFGLEHTVSSQFMINPEFNFQSNSSSNTYYSTTSLGPSILVSYTPNDNWEIFSDLSYNYTKYTGRVVAVQVRRRTQNETETQSLTAFDLGAIYTFANGFSLNGKFAKSKNTSNNDTSAYNADVISFNVGLKI